MLIPKSKICWDCGKRKLRSQFYKNAAHKDGIASDCSKCNRKRRKDYVKKNKTKVYAVNALYRKRNKRKIKGMKLQYAYGIGINDFERMLLRQKFKCLIDGQNITYKTACVDHNHRTGAVRGLLCNDCNKALGFFRDDPKVLKRAIKYLRS